MLYHVDMHLKQIEKNTPIFRMSAKNQFFGDRGGGCQSLVDMSVSNRVFFIDF